MIVDQRKVIIDNTKGNIELWGILHNLALSKVPGTSIIQDIKKTITNIIILPIIQAIRAHNEFISISEKFNFWWKNDCCQSYIWKEV